MFNEYRLTYHVEVIDRTAPDFGKTFTQQMFICIHQKRIDKKEVKREFGSFCPILGFFERTPVDFRLVPEPDPLPLPGYKMHRIKKGTFKVKLEKIEYGFSDYEDVDGSSFQSLEHIRR